MMIFLKEKPVAVMLALKQHKKMYISELARKATVTFVYLKKLLPLLQQFGIVVIKKENKKTYVYLTDKGIEIANLIDELSTKSV